MMQQGNSFITVENSGTHWTATAEMSGRKMIAEGETRREAYEGIFILIAKACKGSK